MNRVVSRIIEIMVKLRTYNGDYDFYEQARDIDA